MTTPCASPTRASTDWRAWGRQVRSPARSPSPAASAPGSSPSTAACPSVPTCRSAATSTAASGGRTAWPGSTSTWRPSPWRGRPDPKRFAVTLTSDSDVYYDPYDFEIDADPHPVWKRMRDEAPLYYNEKYDFFALSRWHDVEPALVNWDTYRSGRGSVLELIQANVELPPGIILFEDPPIHDLHRGLLSRVFTPKKMQAIEPKVRDFCARSLDPLVGAGGFDFIADLGAQMPMRTIGFLLGIPEEDQEAIRDRLDDGLRLEDGGAPTAASFDGGASVFADYIDWRTAHPSDDLLTELLNAEFEDE